MKVTLDQARLAIDAAIQQGRTVEGSLSNDKNREYHHILCSRTLEIILSKPQMGHHFEHVIIRRLPI